MSPLLVLSLLAVGFSTVESATCPTFPQTASEAKKTLNAVCGSARISTACSLWAACSQNSSSSACQPTSVLASYCIGNATHSVCSSIIPKYSSADAALQCWKADGVPQLPVTSYVQEDMRRLCQSQLDNLAGCDICGNATSPSCTNPLGSLASMCYEANMVASWSTTYCKGLEDFCVTLPAGSMKSLCGSSRQSSSTPARSAATTTTSTEPCIKDSTQNSCSEYTYPDSSITNDLKANCDMMSDMTACTAWNLCKSGKASGPNCNIFSILASVCKEMPGMSPCNDYNALCKTGSVVQQCKQHMPIPSLPDTLTLKNTIVTSCADHSMPSCSKCKEGPRNCPDPLSTMAALCHEHAEMASCAGFYSFCTATGATFKDLCQMSSHRYLPSMKMYFHQRVDDIILWRKWVPRNKVAYGLSLLAIMFLGLLSQFLKVVRLMLEGKWAKQVDRQGRGDRATSKMLDMQEGGLRLLPARLTGGLRGLLMTWGQLRRNAIRSTFQGVVMTLDYFNMLIAMTFNAGMFAAVVMGYVLGTLLFSHLLERQRTGVAEDEQYPPPSAPAVTSVDDDADEACNCSPANLDMGCNC